MYNKLLAPVVKVIHEGIGIRHGMITTLHDLSNTQNSVDASHKDLRRACRRQRETLLRGRTQRPPNCIAGYAAHLHGWPFTAKHKAATNCQRPTDQIDQQNAPPIHWPQSVQYRFDMWNTTAASFGREAAHQKHCACRARCAKRGGKQPANQRHTL